MITLLSADMNDLVEWLELHADITNVFTSNGQLYCFDINDAIKVNNILMNNNLGNIHVSIVDFIDMDNYLDMLKESEADQFSRRCDNDEVWYVYDKEAYNAAKSKRFLEQPKLILN